MASSASSKLKSRSHCSDRDIISTLPDAVLSHILSFLPTKHAVLTIILSKRWRNIWTLVPTLDFEDSSNPNSHDLICSVSFMNFVNRVLILRGLTTCIHKFHLSCHLESNSSHINSWICYAIACGVRELNLSYYCPKKDYVHLPRSLFACKMLEVLKLDRDFHMHVPDLVCLPSLRVLHLISLPFLDDSSIENLISSCPVLEELVIIDRDKDNYLKNLKICSSSLKSLKICTAIRSQFHDNECSLSIDAPFLECLDISDHVFGAYNVGKLSSVVKANIDVWWSWWSYIEGEMSNHLPFGVGEVFRGICNVKHLTVSSHTLARIFVASDIVMPTFRNLTHLEVKVRWGGCKMLPDLLRCMPEVTNLVLERVNFVYWDIWLRFSCDMVKYLSRLEMVEIRGFKGFPHEIEFLRLFLENSMALKEMKICCRKTSDAARLDDARKILTGLPRGSKISELVFS